MALVGVAVYFFVTPSYRQGERSVAGKREKTSALLLMEGPNGYLILEGRWSFSILERRTAVPV